MSRLIVLYNYNQYYNRIIKRKSSFQEYQNLITAQGNNPAAYKGFIRENMNFNYEDGVYAQHVLNIPIEGPQYAKIEHPNYLVVEETYVEGEGENAITTVKLSRYFVLSCTKIRGNQWLLSLRRDLLADYYDNVLNAPVFIEKGNIRNYDDPALFNKEAMTYNQIKQGEYLINKNKYSGKGKGWVVGYIAKEQREQAIGPCVGYAEAPATTVQYNNLPTKLKNAITKGRLAIYNANEGSFFVTIANSTNIFDPGWNAELNFGTSQVTLQRQDSPVGSFRLLAANINSGNIAQIQTVMFDTYALPSQPQVLTALNNYVASLSSNEYEIAQTTDALTNYNGVIYQKDNKLYRITVQLLDQNLSLASLSYTNAQLTAGVDAMANGIAYYCNNLALGDYFTDYKYGSSTVSWIRKNAKYYSVTVEEVEFVELKATIPAGRNENFDAPYDIFCIPLGELNVISGNSTIFTTVSNVALPMARGIAITGTSIKIYDIQILPYCPFDEILNSDGDIDITGLENDKDYSYITKTESGVTTQVGIIVFPKSCRGTFDVNIANTEELYNYFIEERNTILAKKIKSETELVRFVAPNFSSCFEINVQKNKGITSLNVDYFYKPYSPYLHVAPYFNGLYGQDFNDPKGLICGGDYSIATSSSKWEEYQIQNKNYELIFNRQIQNLDVNNSLTYTYHEKASDLAILAAGLGGSLGGTQQGAQKGGAAGAIAGMLTGYASGVTLGLVGQKIDLDYLRATQAEARNYAVDMYTYNLGNIRALPYSLTRISSFTENNKIFPFIEVYDCTDEEKNALLNKLRYNGSTIMRIGKIADFLGEYNYVSGQLIRLTGIDEDSQVVAEIAKEIKEGAYYYGNDSE